MPIFQGNCSIGTATMAGACHGDPSDAQAGGGLNGGGSRQYFGPATGTNSAATLMTIWSGFVNVLSTEDVYEDVVTPGSPSTSFILNKLNGTQAALDLENPDQCMRGDIGTCGSQMPLPLSGTTVVPLSQTDIDLICNWIEQGAKNN